MYVGCLENLTDILGSDLTRSKVEYNLVIQLYHGHNEHLISKWKQSCDALN